MADETLRLEWRDAAELEDNPSNWRTHPEAQLAALKDVIGEVGWAGACLFNERTGRLIDGHARKKLGGKVPVLVGSWSEEQEKTILATLDPLAAMAEADTKALDALLREVQTGSEAIGNMLADLATANGIIPALNGTPPEDPGPQIDRAAELQKKWGTTTGQLWEIPSKATPGKNHRLLCGDSTKAEDVARVMGGERAQLCLTDPPYGIGEDYASCTDTPNNLCNLIATFLPQAQRVAKVVLVSTGTKHHRLYPDPDWTLCWFCAAGTGCGPWGFACWQPILAYGKDPYLSSGRGSRPDGLSLMEAAENELGHPCSKPVKVWTWLIERGSCEAGDIIYDSFAGSSTTIVAAEQTARLCYGVEIAAPYVAVSLERLEGMGLEPRLTS